MNKLRYEKTNKSMEKSPKRPATLAAIGVFASSLVTGCEASNLITSKDQPKREKCLVEIMPNESIKDLATSLTEAYIPKDEIAAINAEESSRLGHTEDIDRNLDEIARDNHTTWSSKPDAFTKIALKNTLCQAARKTGRETQPVPENRSL